MTSLQEKIDAIYNTKDGHIIVSPNTEYLTNKALQEFRKQIEDEYELIENCGEIDPIYDGMLSAYEKVFSLIGEKKA